MDLDKTVNFNIFPIKNFLCSPSPPPVIYSTLCTRLEISILTDNYEDLRQKNLNKRKQQEKLILKNSFRITICVLWEKGGGQIVMNEEKRGQGDLI